MFRENVSLKEFSNYKIGGPARYFFVPKTLAETIAGVEKAKKEKLPIFILGGGTNLLISDKGYPGLIVKPEIMVLERRGNNVRVGAGVSVADLLSFLINEELSGLEWAGGLPGTVGGAIRGNAGAFGGEIKDVIKEVVSLDVHGLASKKYSNKESNFTYRSSIFKERDGKEVILEATLELKEGDKEAIRKGIQEKIDFRNTRHPMEFPSLGSTFKNVDVKKLPKEVAEKFEDKIKQDPFPVLPTAVLLSEAGLKGIKEGGAMFSPKHPNFIVNTEGATAEDVEKLIAIAKKTVKEKFGVTLEEEIQRVQ